MNGFETVGDDTLDGDQAKTLPSHDTKLGIARAFLLDEFMSRITTHSAAHIGKRAQFGHDTARGVRYGTRAWLALRAWVLKQAKFLCAKCGKIANQVDHVDNDPTNNTAANLQALCPACHTTKTREQAKK